MRGGVGEGEGGEGVGEGREQKLQITYILACTVMMLSVKCVLRKRKSLMCARTRSHRRSIVHRRKHKEDRDTNNQRQSYS